VHPIVSAAFHGHEHLYAFSDLGNGRVIDGRGAFPQFVSGSAGAAPDTCSRTDRFQDCDRGPGFAVVDVAGPAFRVTWHRTEGPPPHAKPRCFAHGMRD
jgi:hypothetical protein